MRRGVREKYVKSIDAGEVAALLNTGMSHMVYKIETELETDGRWIAEVLELPGVLAYGATEKEAVASVQALAIRVLDHRD
jgi:hypothetical protein